jgi:hypothetical protein
MKSRIIILAGQEAKAFEAHVPRTARSSFPALVGKLDVLNVECDKWAVGGAITAIG